MAVDIDKNKVVIFSGAGISAESGIRTFRDSDGLWNEYLIEEVASPQRVGSKSRVSAAVLQ